MCIHSCKRADDAVGAATDTQGVLAKYVTPVKDILAASGATQAIEHGLNAFMEDIPWLMKGLDEVARIHPVVTGIVAFMLIHWSLLTYFLRSCRSCFQGGVQYGNDAS